jgi:hypothetical protein
MNPSRYTALVKANLRSKFPEARIVSLRKTKERGREIIWCAYDNLDADTKAIEAYLWAEQAWDDVRVYYCGRRIVY